MSTLMSAVFLSILVLYARLVSRLLPANVAWPVVGVSVLMAIAFAQRGSAPLPLGMYSPAAPIGGLLLFGAANAGLSYYETPNTRRALLLGALCGLCILTKPDFWVPAAYLVAVGMLLSFRRPALRARAMAIAGAYGAVVVTGTAVLVMQSGWEILPGVLTGFNHVQEFGSAGLPSWERITVALTMTALVGGALVATVGAANGRSLRQMLPLLVGLGLVVCAGVALHLWMTYRIGMRVAASPNGFVSVFLTEDEMRGVAPSAVAVLRRAFAHLRERLETQSLPLLLPMVVAAVLLVRRPAIRATTQGDAPRTSVTIDVILVLLGLCLAARARRGFEFTEWYHVLLEIPAYAASILLFARERARAIAPLRIALAVLGLVAIRAHWDLGRGPFTERGRFPATQTARGTVHWPRDQVAAYRYLDTELRQRDPSGQRSLFAFAYTGGYAYFLERRNPTPLPQGFRLSRFDADSLVEMMAKATPGAFVLDTRAFDRTRAPTRGLHLTTWEAPTRENHYLRHDRPYFERIITSCVPVAHHPTAERAFLTLHDCGDAPL